MGYPDSEIYRNRRSGAWTRLRSGAYAPTAAVADLDVHDRHRLAVRASMPAIDDRSAVSHQSAGVMHGLELWGLRLEHVHVARHGKGGGHRRGPIHSHYAPLRADEITAVDGIPVTTVARTTVDIARAAGFEQAVVAADCALRMGLTTVADLVDTLAHMRRWPGAARAARVVMFANGLAESVGESRSRVLIFRAGLPAPRLQVPLFSRDGEFLGRGDFVFGEQRTVAEFDGMIKYGRTIPKGGAWDPERVSQAIVAEKLREDAIRRTPLSIGRWIWAELEVARVRAIVLDAFRVGETFARV
jgi:predicted transcriptional regulator of viral defense system